MWGKSSSQKAQGPEERIDPHDGNSRTYAELAALCKNEYNAQEIEDYWNKMRQCESGGIHNVTDDPFLTDLSRLQRPSAAAELTARGSMRSGTSSGPGQPRETVPASGRRPQQAQPMVSPVDFGMADVKSDPFLTADGVHDVASVREDPFLTHQQRMAMQQMDDRQSMDGGKRKQFAQKAAKAQKDSVEMILRVVGDGSVDRERPALTILIVLPWLLFCWCLVLGLVLRHYSAAATFVLFGICALSSGAMLLLWVQGQRRGPISFLIMGILCLIAVTAGGATSVYGWNRYWRQFWWTQTGFRSSATSALTPAAARADYSVLNFWNDNVSSTFNDTRVDHSKAAGYKDTDYYCVAPVLAPASAGATIVRVNFWAVGINCCQRYGGFTCDDARESEAATAIVMLNGGMPCPTCNIDKFQKAVAKAEAAHGLVSVDGAVFVRWASASTNLEAWMTVWAVSYLLLCAAGALAFFYFFGGISWYYGLGIQQKSEPFFGGGLRPAYTADGEKIANIS